MTRIRLTYDPDAGAAQITLGRGGPHSAVTIPLSLLEDEADEAPALRDINLDFDADGRLLGIEILAAERWLPRDVLGG